MKINLSKCEGDVGRCLLGKTVDFHREEVKIIGELWIIFGLVDLGLMRYRSGRRFVPVPAGEERMLRIVM